MVIKKKIKWFSDILKIDYQTTVRILKYLNLYEGEIEYDFSILNELRNFLKENSNTKSFFINLANKNRVEETTNDLTSKGLIPLSYIFSTYNLDYWRVLVILSNNDIKIKHLKKIGYITREEFNKVKDFLNTYDNYVAPPRSFPQEDVYQFISSFYKKTIIKNCRSIITPLELDLYLPDCKVAIEFNGIYWHSSLHNTPINYHFNKSKLCSEKGIRLIHIYENEWNDLILKEKIKSLLYIALGFTPNRIYAKNCILKEISNSTAKEFNELNHLQGHRNAQITYGLYYENRLVQLMSFSKTKYNRNLKTDNSWEIIRGCPASNNIVVGGVSKLYKHFLKNMNPEVVFSYCDFNKFDGHGYEALGMKFIGYTGPDMKWIMPGCKIVNRNPKKHNEYKKYAIGKIWGSGSKKYIWLKEKENG